MTTNKNLRPSNSLDNYKKKSTFLKGLVLFLFVLFILDFSIGKTLKHLYFEQQSGSLYQVSYILDSVRSQIVILGSSTAAHSFEPNTFQNRTGLSFFNTGYDGTCIIHQNVFLQSILNTHHPRAIILVADINEFKYLDLSYERLSILLPYYDSHAIVRPTIDKKSTFEKLKLNSSIYPFNSTLFTVVIRNKIFNEYNSKRKEDINGYIPLKKINNKPLETVINAPDYKLDSNKIQAFKNILIECKKRDINLYLVVTPRYINYINTDPSIRMVEDYAKRFNIRLINLLNNIEFKTHPEYFADLSHLNDDGAKVFSNMVIDSLITESSFRSILPKDVHN